MSPSRQGTVLLVAAAETALRTREAWCLQAALLWSHSDVRPMIRHCVSWVSTSLSTLAGCRQSWSRTWKRAKARRLKKRQISNETKNGQVDRRQEFEKYDSVSWVNLRQWLLKGLLFGRVVRFSWKAHEQVKTLHKSSREPPVYTGQNILKTHIHNRQNTFWSNF